MKKEKPSEWFKVKLTKIQSNHQNLRTNEILGTCMHLPVEGSVFYLMAPPLESGNVRLVTTTVVQKVVDLGSVLDFETENSSYKLEILSKQRYSGMASVDPVIKELHDTSGTDKS